MKYFWVDLRKFLWRILWRFARWLGYQMPDTHFRIWWFMYIVGGLYLAQMSRAEIAKMKVDEQNPMVRAILDNNNSALGNHRERIIRESIRQHKI